MSVAVELRGSQTPVEIAPGGYTLHAPQLQATVRELTPAESGSRSDGGVHEAALLKAVASADVYPQKWFEIEVKADDAPKGGSGPARAGGLTATTRDGEPAVVLRVPSLGKNVNSAVLYTDEAGVSRWVFPEPAAAPAAGGTSCGVGATVVFHLPRPSAPGGGTSPQSRGWVAKLGRRMVRVLAWATDDIVGKGAQYVAARWEGSHRPYALRRVEPRGAEAPLAPDDLCNGHALLLLHGTFSSARGAFAELPEATWKALHALYEGRIFAFDHPSVHASPRENAQTFIDMLPPDADLVVDVITHSRGGLVGRELAERQGELDTKGRTLKVRKAVLVASPNLGTKLADGDHGISLLDRYTALFTALPDTAFVLGMEGLFMVAKLLLHGALKGLPGLASMDPPGDYLQRINTGPAGPTRYYAVAARFKPDAPGVVGAAGAWLASKVFTDIYGEPNDGVVPTRGCYECALGAGSFPVPVERRLVFEEDAGAHHCNIFRFFDRANLVGWLGE